MEVQKKEDVTVLFVDDRLDATSGQGLKDMVKSIADQPEIKLVIDMSQTKFVDSSGCGALVASLKAVLKNEGDMKIACPSAQAKSLFQITRLDKVFEMYDHQETAVKSFF